MSSVRKKVRIGIFGGSFNPIHFGHLRGAEVVRERFSLEKVLFVPAYKNPQKTDEELISAEHRLRMVELAVEDNVHFEVSDMEVKRKEPSYTVDTLQYLNRSISSEQLYFIMGSELFSSIHTWKDYRSLFFLSNFIVMIRPGENRASFKEIPNELKDDFRYSGQVFENSVAYEHILSNHRLIFTDIDGFELSSTAIRNILHKGLSIKYLVPIKVENYIINNNLYRREEK